MKRKITFLAALSAAALILAGCGETGTSTTGDASSSNDSQAPSTSVSTSEGETSASSSDIEAGGNHTSSSEEESLPPASNPDDSKPDTSEPSVSTDIPAEAQGEDHGMSLMMMGGLNKNAIRSVYAIFDDKSADVELTWATDNAAVVEIYTTFGGSMPEALLSARGIGTATIECIEYLTTSKE